jgi:hypothetical protein
MAVRGFGFRDCSEMLICSEVYNIVVCPKVDILYLRTTPKLSNKNTKVIKMECPYLFIDPGRKICRQMTEQGLDGELDDFDVTHYCKGNPNHCFFFRFNNNRIQVTGQSEGNEPDVPIVPLAPIVLNEPIQLDEPSSEHSDKLLKLKRFLRLKS